MSKQDCTIKQSTKVMKLDDEFQNIENVIKTVFKTLEEFDRLEFSKKEKIGGENLS